MTLKNVKALLKLIAKNEDAIFYIQNIEKYVITHTKDHKHSIQQLQQLRDWMEALKQQVINDKEFYKEQKFLKIMDKLKELMEEMNTEILILKIQ